MARLPFTSVYLVLQLLQLFLSANVTAQLSSEQFSATSVACKIVLKCTSLPEATGACEYLCSDLDSGAFLSFVPSTDMSATALTAFFDDNQPSILGGSLTVQVNNCVVSSDGQITTNDDTEFEHIGERRAISRDEIPGLFGTKIVLVIRAAFKNAVPITSTSEMSGNIFGGFGDVVNLNSQFSACSHGKFNFAPATGNGVNNGVLDISINDDLTTNYNAAAFKVTQAVADAGFTEDQDYDHLIICIPPGSGSWLAYAYVGTPVSVYNAQWCGYVSVLMHEVGHNLGFLHSGHGTSSYGDQVGIMGYSYNEDDTPLMCFNGAKSYYTNWYNTCDVEITAQETLKLSNIVDDPQGADFCTIIRIRTSGSDEAYYIQYNRKKGINLGTKEAEDKVAITKSNSMFETSDLVAVLGQGESFTLSPGANTIQVGDFASAGGSDYITVSIGGGGDLPAPIPAPVPSPAPTPNSDCVSVVVKMQDSYGDGWNGNKLVITEKPKIVKSFSLENGHSYTSQPFCLYKDECYDITCNGGSWKTEVSWQLEKKVGGGVELTGGAPFEGELCT